MKIILKIFLIGGFCVFAFYLISFLFGLLLPNTFDRIKNLPNLFPHKTDSFDFSKKESYSNNYLGISFDYADALNFEESSSGGFSYHEDYGIVGRQGNIMFYDKNRSNSRDHKFDVLHVVLEYGKFNPDNEIFIPVDCGDKAKELSPVLVSFVKKLEATCLEKQEVYNVKQFDLNGNHYYAFSYIYLRDRIDKYFLIRENEYILLTFSNQNQEFIKSILSSVKTFEPIR